jgi:hypothetical protein
VWDENSISQGIRLIEEKVRWFFAVFSRY